MTARSPHRAPEPILWLILAGLAFAIVAIGYQVIPGLLKTVLAIGVSIAGRGDLL